MIANLEKSKHLGMFTIEPDRQVYGELTLAGWETSLYLWDKEFFGGWERRPLSINGVLHDLTKVSFSDCVRREGPGLRSGDGEIHYCKFFPHYSVFGNQHISFAENTVKEVGFTTDDATVLFNDYDAFGRVIGDHSLIKQIVDSEHLDRKIKTGEFPIIAYFSGEHEIVVADTVLGRVSVSHNPSSNFGGPDGIEIRNTILVKLLFDEAVSFEESMYRFYRTLSFLEVLVGRPQNLLQLTVSKAFGEQRPIRVLQVYPSGFPKHERRVNGISPQPYDVLIDAVRRPAEFSCVLANWLARDGTWRNARASFSSNFSKQQKHDKNRVVAAANMFDLLPDDATPDNVELSKELEAATCECRRIFKDLSNSLEQQSVLSALGRVGQFSLKQKIRHRGMSLVEKLGDNLPDLFIVTDEAVNCRNYYVHGSRSRIDYGEKPDIMAFLTETLEFVFAASDLIESGWNIKAWYDNMAGHHPFGWYLRNYQAELARLKSCLGSQAAAQ